MTTTAEVKREYSVRALGNSDALVYTLYLWHTYHQSETNTSTDLITDWEVWLNGRRLNSGIEPTWNKARNAAMRFIRQTRQEGLTQWTHSN